jgi:hypothetical protein
VLWSRCAVKGMQSQWAQVPSRQRSSRVIWGRNTEFPFLAAPCAASIGWTKTRGQRERATGRAGNHRDFCQGWIEMSAGLGGLKCPVRRQG